MSDKGIWIVNAANLFGGVFYFAESERELDIEIKRAFTKSAFAGGFSKHHQSMMFVDPRAITTAVTREAVVAEANGMFPVYLKSNVFSDEDVVSVCDWASELQRHSPKIHAAVLKRKLTYTAMIDHARRWHEAAARRAEKLRDRAIERDDVGAPTVLDLDGDFEGWRWVWLMSDDARDAEGRVMGHCVGDGYYDTTGDGHAVFSLRDPKGVPHVTVELHGTDLEQAQCRGNTTPPPRFEPLIENVRAVVGLRLAMFSDPETPIATGVHRVNDAEYHVLAGRLHRDVGPALICSYQAEYFENGVPQMTRFVINRLTEEEWYDDAGLPHRDGGPARIAYSYHPEAEKTEWWQHGERVEEDGTPWVEPKNFRRGDVGTNGDKTFVVMIPHTAKHVDPDLSVEVTPFADVKVLKALGAREIRLEKGWIRSFTVSTMAYECHVFIAALGEVSVVRKVNDRLQWAVPAEEFRGYRARPWAVDVEMEDGFTPALGRWPELAQRWEEWKAAS